MAVDEAAGQQLVGRRGQGRETAADLPTQDKATTVDEAAAWPADEAGGLAAAEAAVGPFVDDLGRWLLGRAAVDEAAGATALDEAAPGS